MLGVMLYTLCVALLMDLSVCLVCCVFVNCLVKQFAICLDVVVMEVFSVGGDALLDRPYMVFQRMCMLGL